MLDLGLGSLATLSSPFVVDKSIVFGWIRLLGIGFFDNLIIVVVCLGNTMYIYMGVRQYAPYVNVITASGSASGLHRGTHQVITLSVKLCEGVSGACPYEC